MELYTRAKRLLTEEEAARFLSVSRSYLAQIRCNLGVHGHSPAPPFVKFGHAVRYDIQDLTSWIERHRVTINGETVCPA